VFCYEDLLLLPIPTRKLKVPAKNGPSGTPTPDGKVVYRRAEIAIIRNLHDVQLQFDESGFGSITDHSHGDSLE